MPRTWTTSRPEAVPVTPTPPAASTVLYVVDVSGEVVIIDAGYTPQASAVQIEESQRMVESGRFVKAP
jgi:glyoxylase-like metal-dependent hydrolase (beta-lactamase superfamily II)